MRFGSPGEPKDLILGFEKEGTLALDASGLCRFPTIGAALQPIAAKAAHIDRVPWQDVDIRTGEKTILDYLIKPMNRAREALR